MYETDLSLVRRVPREMTSVCAWCGDVVNAVAGSADVTHTICAGCFDRQFASPDAAARLARPAAGSFTDTPHE